MTANIPISGPQPSTAPQNNAPSSANPITAGAVASSNSSGEVNSNTVIGSLNDLKKKAPEVYQKMMESMAMNVCNGMRDHQDRLKRMMREGNAR